VPLTNFAEIIPINNVQSESFVALTKSKIYYFNIKLEEPAKNIKTISTLKSLPWSFIEHFEASKMGPDVM
jgi:hypothetical protein